MSDKDATINHKGPFFPPIKSAKKDLAYNGSVFIGTLVCYAGLSILWFVAAVEYLVTGVSECKKSWWGHNLPPNWGRGKVLSCLEACFRFDLRLLTSDENSNQGWEIYRKSGVQIPATEGQNIFFLFPFPFQILHKKLHIHVFNHHILQIRYQ